MQKRRMQVLNPKDRGGKLSDSGCKAWLQTIRWWKFIIVEDIFQEKSEQGLHLDFMKLWVNPMMGELSL